VVAFPLPREAVEAGYRVIGFDSVGSTNDEAMEAARAGDAGRLWVAALQQTKGRGRRGRPWQSPHGNLAASLLIVPDSPPESLASLGFVAGVALNGALAQLAPRMRLVSGIDGADGAEGGSVARIALKWPNDVLADGAKLAGIMLEAQTRPDGTRAVVIGFGVNVVAAPQDTPYPATSLAALGFPFGAETVFEALVSQWIECYELWQQGNGTAAIIARWRESAAGIGAEVSVKRDGDVVRGIFETIDDAGHLIVREPDGRRIAIAAGDVHFGATATLRD